MNISKVIINVILKIKMNKIKVLIIRMSTRDYT